VGGDVRLTSSMAGGSNEFFSFSFFHGILARHWLLGKCRQKMGGFGLTVGQAFGRGGGGG
jgi:hypothetical protein